MSNITVPLLGMIDVTIVGHMGSPVYIGAAVGSMIFNLVYWLFGFLRTEKYVLFQYVLHIHISMNRSETLYIFVRSSF